MATITYYTTPAAVEKSFSGGGSYRENVGSTSGTLSYGNLDIEFTGTNLTKASGVLKTVTLYVNDNKAFAVSGLSLNILKVAQANDPFDYVMDRAFGGADTITGSKYSDTLYGYAGNDTIKGLAGNDRITGGTGKDKLYGGTGNDIFDFNKVSESGITSSSRDIVADFVRGSDKVDLSTIDANTGTTGNNSFTKLITSGSFTAAGQLKFVAGVVCGNTDSDAAAEFSIGLTGISKLSLSDFVL